MFFFLVAPQFCYFHLQTSVFVKFLLDKAILWITVSFGFRYLFFWGGGGCVGPPHIRSLIPLWNRHAADAEKSKTSLWWGGIFRFAVRLTVSHKTLSHPGRQRTDITGKITPGHGSASGRWSRSRGWSWRLCLVLVTRASKIWATLATSARWCRSSSASQTSRGCESNKQ